MWRHSLHVDGRSPDQVRLEVTNEGVLPSGVEDSLFAPFVRPGPTSGTGLGLFIVDQVARAHGGTVRGASLDGRTTFTLTLPRHAPVPGSTRRSSDLASDPRVGSRSR